MIWKEPPGSPEKGGLEKGRLEARTPMSSLGIVGVTPLFGLFCMSVS